MPLVCEDLAAYGAVLIPPGSQQYFDLLADIEGRLRDRVKGAGPVQGDALSRISTHDGASAILLNRSQAAIAALAYIWSIRRPDGRETTSSYSPGTNPSVLLPFFQMERIRKWDAYWNTIFSGSKRVVTLNGVYGDNTDVRMPEADETFSGGGFSAGAGGTAGEPLKLTLDGVFFADGGFTGPNQLRSWDNLVAARGAFLAFAREARGAAGDAAARAAFFERMLRMSGLAEGRAGFPMPPPPPPRPGFSRPAEISAEESDAIREYEEKSIARQVLSMREQVGDEAMLSRVAAWLDRPGPEPHRL